MKMEILSEQMYFAAKQIQLQYETKQRINVTCNLTLSMQTLHKTKNTKYKIDMKPI